MRAWLGAVAGLEGRRKDAQTAQTALAFLMRLESDPFYASPEQTRGGEKDSRGLVYSLALFLFERLTGHHPFVESLSPLECRIQQAKAKRVGTNNLCHLPRDLRVIISRALSPFPEDRYEDIARMRREVETWRVGEAPCSEQDVPPMAPAVPKLVTPQRRHTTVPPPIPAPRKAFAAADTLQGAVVVSSTIAEASPPVQASTSAPWLWPSISGGFALLAAIALFVAVQVGSKPSPAQASPGTVAASSAAVPVRAIPSPASTESPLLVPAGSTIAAGHSSPANVKRTAEARPIEQTLATKKSSESQLVDLVRDCVATNQLRGGVSLGISIRFSAEGTTTKSFTGRMPFTRSETQCIKTALRTVVTASESEVGEMMSYDLYISIASERTRVRVAKH